MSLDRLMVRIYQDPKDYKYDLAWLPVKYGTGQAGWSRSQTKWEVHLIPESRKLAVFNSEEECKAFIESRVNPVEVAPKVYPEICRCGRYDEEGRKAWKYVKCEELVFECCPYCNLPMRHDVMLELNRKLIEDFDLEAFLGL